MFNNGTNLDIIEVYNSKNEKREYEYLADLRFEGDLQVLVSIQDQLAIITQNEIDSLVKFIVSSNKLKECVHLISIMSSSLPKKADLYAELLDKINPPKGYILKYSNSMYPILVMKLVKKGKIGVNETKNILVDVFYGSIYTKKIESVPECVLRFYSIEKLKENDFKIINEIIDYSYPKDSIGYFIKTDDIASFTRITTENKIPNDSNYFCLDALKFIDQKNPLVSLISIAAFYGSWKVFTYLYSNGAKPSKDLLHLAIAGGDSQVVDFLSDNDLIQDPMECNALEISLQTYQHRFVDFILENYRNAGLTMYESARCMNLKCLLYCLMNNFNIISEESTVVHILVEEDFPEITKHVLQYINKVDVKDSSNLTPLHIAAKNNSYECIDILVEKGADINLQTPLVYYSFKACLHFI